MAICLKHLVITLSNITFMQFCTLKMHQIMMQQIIDRDQAQLNIRPDLDQNCLTL